MNIIDTSSSSNKNKDFKKSIKNIPLFKTKGIEYELLSKEYTNIIFQSIASVDFFKEHELIKNKNVFSMGKSTQNYLAQKKIKSISPNSPGSEELKKLLSKNKNGGNYLIVKGEEGLSEIFNYLNVADEIVDEVICYKRIKFDNYEHIKEAFYKVDAIIFTSTYAFEIFFEEIYSKKMNLKFLSISQRISKFIKEKGFNSDLIDYFSNDLEEQIKKLI